MNTTRVSTQVQGGWEEEKQGEGLGGTRRRGQRGEVKRRGDEEERRVREEGKVMARISGKGRCTGIGEVDSRVIGEEGVRVDGD